MSSARHGVPLNVSDDERTEGSTDIASRLRRLHREATERRIALRRDFERIVEASQSVSTDDEHDPEGATIAFERAQVTALLGQTERQLADLSAAVARLDAGSYGRCAACGRPIGAQRLSARPAASRCIDCAT